MTLNPAASLPRNLGILMIAAFAGAALWLFVPAVLNRGAGSSSGDGGSASAALPASLKVDGAVQTESHDNIITRLVVPLAVRGDQGITLTDDSGNLSAETAMSDTAAAAVPATYTLKWLDGNGDRVLDPGEHALLTVDLPAVSTVHPGNPLNLVIKPVGGPTLTIENVLGN